MNEQRRIGPHVCCAQTPPPQLLLVKDPAAPRHARAFTREFLSSRLPDITASRLEDVELVVSELVTNAFRYGTEPGDSIMLTLTAEPCRIRVEVADAARRHPKVCAPGDQRTRGRGLLLVDALATKWGVDDRPFGKTVWAELA